MQKSTVVLYTKNELPERKIKNITPFTFATKMIKYLGIKCIQGCERAIH